MNVYAAIPTGGVNIGDTNIYAPARWTSIGSLVSVILPNIYVLAGIIFLILLIGGGVGMIMGAGQDDPKKTASGSSAVTMALAGFLLIFCSYWIIKIIETVTGLNILNSAL